MSFSHESRNRNTKMYPPQKGLNPYAPMYFATNNNPPQYSLYPLMIPPRTMRRQTTEYPQITIKEASNKENHSEYIVKFGQASISVTVTYLAEVVDGWIHKTILVRNQCNLFGRLVIGLGVQWKPSKTNRYNTPADTLQLCVGTRCLIFQLSHADTIPISLRGFLLDPSNTFVGVWNSEDENKLRISKHKLELNGRLFDMRFCVRDRNGKDLQYEKATKIRQECLGYRGKFLNAAMNQSDWNAENLSEDQVKFACIDSYLSFLIGKMVRAWELISAYAVY